MKHYCPGRLTNWQRNKRGKKLIKGGDWEANYAYYALHKFNWEPSKFINLPIKEKIFVIACIDLRIKEEKKESKNVKT